jgi:hypothetical protein
LEVQKAKNAQDLKNVEKAADDKIKKIPEPS